MNEVNAENQKQDPYTGWQEKHTAQLMDGSSSTKSYVRIATFGELEVGVKPSVGRHSTGSIHLNLHLRVARKNVEQLVEDPDAEGSNVVAFPQVAPGAKSSKLKELMGVLPSVQWNNINENRASTGVSIIIPLTIADAAEFGWLIEHGDLAKDLLTVVTKRTDLNESTAGVRALNDWLRLVANVKDGLFVEPLDTLPPVAELPERMAKWHNGLKEAAKNAAAGA